MVLGTITLIWGGRKGRGGGESKSQKVRQPAIAEMFNLPQQLLCQFY